MLQIIILHARDERKLFKRYLSIQIRRKKMTTTEEEIKKMSLQFLRKLYELSGEDDSMWFNTQQIFKEFFKELGLDSESEDIMNKKREGIINYLLKEKLITTVIEGNIIGITQRGIRMASSQMKV